MIKIQCQILFKNLIIKDLKFKLIQKIKLVIRFNRRQIKNNLRQIQILLEVSESKELLLEGVYNKEEPLEEEVAQDLLLQQWEDLQFQHKFKTLILIIMKFKKRYH